MRDRFTITITDISGSKHYTLHQVIKVFAIYFSIFMSAIFIFGGFAIYFLIDEVTELDKKKNELTVFQKNLLEDNNILQEKIKTKTVELEQINDKVNDIEELIGIKEDIKDDNLEGRLQLAALAFEYSQAFFQNIPNSSPVKHDGVSSPFGWRQNPILKTNEFHPAVDLRAKTGTPVYATADGVVEFAEFHKGSGFGNLLILLHNYGFETRYAHLNKFAVKEGDFVKKGELIAYVGSTGLSTGSHLHYEIRFIKRILDPQNFLDWNSGNFNEIFKKENRVAWESLIEAITAQNRLQKPQLSQAALK